MSALASIKQLLMNTESVIAGLERDLAKHPNLPSIINEIESVKEWKEELEASFLEEADALGEEVFRYRIIPSFAGVKAKAMGDTVSEFQDVFSLIYEALITHPVNRPSTDSAHQLESALNFGYCFSGSVGFVFTVPKYRIFDDAPIRESVDLVLQLAKSQGPSDIRRLSEKLGRTPINAFYRWASENARNGFSVGLQWHHAGKVDADVVIQPQQFHQVSQAINETSDTTTTELKIRGEMFAANVRKRRFRFEPDVGEEFSGSSGNLIDKDHYISLPRRYEVTVRKRTRTKFSTGTEVSSYRLLGLKSIR